MPPRLSSGIHPASREDMASGPRRSGVSMISTVAEVTAAARSWLLVMVRCRFMNGGII